MKYSIAAPQENPSYNRYSDAGSFISYIQSFRTRRLILSSKRALSSLFLYLRVKLILCSNSYFALWPHARHEVKRFKMKFTYLALSLTLGAQVLARPAKVILEGENGIIGKARFGH